MRTQVSPLIVPLLASALFGVCPCAARLAVASESSPPNIIFIFCDNLGYGDVGCFNPEAKQQTPRIDRMAAEGIKFTDCYAAAAVCTPSRAALMTGCYPRRVGLDITDPDGLVLRPVSPNGLNPKEITIAELLKSQGYATACIGKWHLGDQPPFLPTSQGFDYFFGIPYSDDMTARASRPTWPPLPLMENEKVIDAPVDRNLLTKRYTERTIEFIEDHRDKPFFIYLPQAMPGSTATPFASEAFRGKSANGPWGDSVEGARLVNGRDSRRREAARPGGEHAGDLHERQRCARSGSSGWLELAAQGQCLQRCRGRHACAVHCKVARPDCGRDRVPGGHHADGHASHVRQAGGGSGTERSRYRRSRYPAFAVW